jgi:hypothetical protein
MTYISLVIAPFLTLTTFRLQCPQHRRVYLKYSDIATLSDSPHSHIPLLLSAWAHPNKRLVRVFGLGNSFVSADTGVRRQFIARARELLRNHTQCFAAFPDSAWNTIVGVVSHLLSSHPHQNAIPFARFVQVVTIRLVIYSFLRDNVPFQEHLDSQSL